MIRVAVVDDHPIVLDGIAANLEQAGDITLTARGKDAGDAVRIAQSGEADVIVLDLELPDNRWLPRWLPTPAALHPKQAYKFCSSCAMNRLRCRRNVKVKSSA